MKAIGNNILDGGARLAAFWSGQAGVLSLGLTLWLALATSAFVLGFFVFDFKPFLLSKKPSFTLCFSDRPEDVGVGVSKRKLQIVSFLANSRNDGFVEPLLQWSESDVSGVLRANNLRGFSRGSDDLGIRANFDSNVRNLEFASPSRPEICEPDFYRCVRERKCLDIGRPNQHQRIDQYVGTLRQLNGITLVAELNVGDPSSAEREEGEHPVGPFWRVIASPPGSFLWGLFAIGVGCRFAYRSQFVRDRPEIAFVLLSAYGFGIALLIGLLGWLSEGA